MDKEKCDHEFVMVYFDIERARAMTKRQVRAQYPRYFGPCPSCGTVLIKYASKEHYVYGDW